MTVQRLVNYSWDSVGHAVPTYCYSKYPRKAVYHFRLVRDSRVTIQLSKVQRIDVVLVGTIHSRHLLRYVVNLGACGTPGAPNPKSTQTMLTSILQRCTLTQSTLVGIT
ncbi:uncharacterized protein LOC107273514 [Cephus cinctus]|uniref:Uncharacterized protein LOC107273514 n=1 Tax=Cephus cinctus TaxID=211228 RepID=A0AAJ7CCC0_CEPCN|nr:uncharacterized protein LOC107273514 [Cephus cinctus]